MSLKRSLSTTLRLSVGTLNAQVSSIDSKGFTFGNRTNRNGAVLAEHDMTWHLKSLWNTTHNSYSSREWLYKDTTAQVRSPDGETDSFTILAESASRRYLSTIPIHHSIGLCSKNGYWRVRGSRLHLRQERKSSRYPAEMVTDTDFCWWYCTNLRQSGKGTEAPRTSGVCSKPSRSTNKQY